MPERPVRVRVAPSPTGDPHVGTAYMSLFDLAFARQQGGQFVLRIEDTDQGRYVEHSEQQIFETLHWLGLDWDEGPDRGGPFAPYRQSQRLPLYQAAAQRLIEAGHAYHCWCSPERLAQMRAEQQRNRQPTGYDRLCLGKSREQRAAEAGFSERPVVRMRIPDDLAPEFDDLIRGRISAPMPDDQVLLKSDGFPSYHLAVVVDDHEMQISHVTRGEEWISSTPKHLLLYRWFGWEPPKFAHFPLLRNPDRSKISKRKNPAARLLWFREQGYLPEALLNFLALMGWSLPDGREIFTFDDLATHFAWDRFSLGGSIFDMDKLDWLNHQYIQALSDEAFLERARPFLPADGELDALRILARDLKERTRKLSEIPEQVEFLYTGALDLEAEALTKQGFDAETAREALAVTEAVLAEGSFEPAAVEARLNATQVERGWNKRRYFMTVRVALTGKPVSPPIHTTIAALARERTLARLRDAQAVLGSGVPSA